MKRASAFGTLSLSAQEALTSFAQGRDEFHRCSDDGDPALLDRAFDLITRYEVMSARLYRLRAARPQNDPLLRRAEDFVSEASQELIAIQKQRRTHENGYAAWVARYRRIWRENLPLFLFTAIVFIVAAIAAWSVVSAEPSTAVAILPQHMLESVIAKHKWFEEIQASPVIEGLRIAANNIQVSINCFLLGALLGLGGMMILGYNGLMVGAILAFCAAHGFEQEILGFITGHGALELTIIVASAFASFHFGRVFYMRPYGLFRRRMSLAARDAGVVLVGICPWLVLAACIEVFISPWPTFDMPTRLLISTGVALAFWVWTFWPSRELKAAGRNP